MNSRTEKLASEVLGLSEDERSELIARVRDSLGRFADADVERAWLDLAEKRWKEIETGGTTVVSADAAMKRARRAIR